MKCINCKFYNKDDSECDYVEWDDDDYPHLNSKGMGIKAEATDDTGMIVALRVDPDFGCVKFVEEESSKATLNEGRAAYLLGQAIDTCPYAEPKLVHDWRCGHLWQKLLDKSNS